MTNFVIYRVYTRQNLGPVEYWDDWEEQPYSRDYIKTTDYLFHGSELAWRRYRQLCNELKKTNAEVSIFRKIIPIDKKCEIKMAPDSWILIERSMMEESVG